MDEKNSINYFQEKKLPSLNLQSEKNRGIGERGSHEEIKGSTRELSQRILLMIIQKGLQKWQSQRIL